MSETTTSDGAPEPGDPSESRVQTRPSGTPTPRRLPKLTWWHAGALALGLGLGAVGAGVPALTALSEAQSTTAKLAEDRTKLADDLNGTKDVLDQAKKNLTAANDKVEALEQAASEVRAREDAVSAREAAVSTTEQTIASNSFGEGVRIVGTNTAAGVYTTGEITSGMCYYVWRTSTASDSEIVDNNIVKSGTATVTLRDGEIFESNRCGKWTKVG